LRAGQFVSRVFAVLLRKNNPQSHHLQTAPVLSVRVKLQTGIYMSDTELLLLIESKKKSGGIAAILNLFLPGAGYMYCGRWILGIFVLFAVVAIAIATGGIFAIGIIIILVIDGFLCANRYNKVLIKNTIQERANLQRNTVSAERLNEIEKMVSEKKCPECAESVKNEALKCRFCGYSFSQQNKIV
jgi:TM2 domain-containing membrane protein YozV